MLGTGDLAGLLQQLAKQRRIGFLAFNPMLDLGGPDGMYLLRERLQHQTCLLPFCIAGVAPRNHMAWHGAVPVDDGAFFVALRHCKKAQQIRVPLQRSQYLLR